MLASPKRKTTTSKTVKKKKAARLRSSSLRDLVAGPTTKQIEESFTLGKSIKLQDFKKGVKF